MVCEWIMTGGQRPGQPCGRSATGEREGHLLCGIHVGLHDTATQVGGRCGVCMARHEAARGPYEAWLAKQHAGQAS